jgi:hypothetical protein
MRTSAIMAALAGSAMLAAAADAQTITFSFPISGSQEVPPVSSGAMGEAVVEFNPATNELMWHVMVTGLTGGFRGAHFHQAPFGVNGPVVIDITGNWMADPPAQNNTGHLIGMTVISEALENALLAGNLYINVHSNEFTGGELRGQVVPIPGSLALLGLAGLAACRRRR